MRSMFTRPLAFFCAFVGRTIQGGSTIRGGDHEEAREDISHFNAENSA